MHFKVNITRVFMNQKNNDTKLNLTLLYKNLIKLNRAVSPVSLF
jgi:hypothetical protein